jgi:outer membrane protein OmpA-like peptidoglycan-associated protein
MGTLNVKIFRKQIKICNFILESLSLLIEKSLSMNFLNRYPKNNIVMASKKYLFLAALFSLLVLSATSYGQNASSTIGSHDYLDTAYVPESRMAQQESFLNNESIYPAKTRDMWELGVHGGYYMIFGDVYSQPGFGAGLSLRKALGYTFSLRASAMYGQAKGIGYQRYSNANLPAGDARNAYAMTGFVPAYKMTAITGSIDVLASLNNIMFHKTAPKVNWYVLAGYSALVYKTKFDALNGSSAYNFGNLSGKRKDIIKNIKDQLDGSYETYANVNHRTQNSNKPEKGPWLRHSLDAGVGVAFKVSPRFNIGVEQKFTLPFDDQIDGVFIGGSKDNDLISYSNVHLNFNLGSSSKRTEPLWWMNPLDYAYSELNAPRHMKLPTPVLPDADGDGVTDQFDQDPNTPAGAAVDVHGKALDTDGDGVPDYQDKQLITPTYCQPVDADGVGKCPCPDSSCYEGLMKAQCDLGVLPSITFKGRSVSLGQDQQALLADVANRMRQSPDCRVVVTGHAEASKSSEQLSWDRVNSVIDYLTQQQGISADRFIFQYSGIPGDNHTVDLRTASDADQGPNMVPPPHPNLRRSK